MTNKSETLTKARTAFDCGDFDSAYAFLKVLGSDDIWSELNDKESKRWLNNKQFADYFWIALNDSSLEGLLTCLKSLEFLTKYFRDGYNRSPRLIPNYSIKYGDQIVEAIRYNQLFVKPEWDDFLDSLPLAPSFEIHRKLWQKARTNERALWANVEKNKIEIKGLSPDILLSCTTIAFEQLRFYENDKQNSVLLASTYSCLMQMLLSGLDALDFSKLETEKIQTTFISIFGRLLSHKTVKEFIAVDNLIKALIGWQQHRNWIVEQYSYVKEMYPIEIGGELFLRNSPQKHYQFQIDGARYDYNALMYFHSGKEFLEELLKNELTEIPDGRYKDDKNSNHVFACQKWSTFLFLHDLGIEKISSSNSSLELIDWSGGLMGYSFNRMNRYEIAMNNLSDRCSNWVEAYAIYMRENYKNKGFTLPFEFWQQDEFESFLISANDGFEKESFKFIYYQISYSNQAKKAFDRFNYIYDAIQKPFVRSGSMIFSPQFIFATNSWFYYSALVAMDYQKFGNPKRFETEKYELNLFKAFHRKSSWSSELMTLRTNLIEGDVDIMVSDGIDVLWIQAKRTLFRLNPKDTRNEEINSDNKAAHQLIKAEQSVKSKELTTQFQLPTKKWIVSNSFENIGNIFSECIKVNYFELIRALNIKEINTLKELENYLISNQELQSISNAYQDSNLSEDEYLYFKDTLDAFKLFDSRDFIFPIGEVKKENVSPKYELYNSAQKLFDSGNLRQALDAWRNYAEIYPTDHEVWESLGNTYADLHDYENAIQCLKRSLELIPGCPKQMRNLAVTYFEAGLTLLGILQYLDILELYPILIPIRAEIKERLRLTITNALIKNEELILLEPRLRKLGLI